MDGGPPLDDDTFAAIREAVLAITGELELDAVLQRLADVARDLVGARYAAIGVPDGAGGFARFVTAGVSDETIAAIGWLPRTHGILGALLEVATPIRLSDVRADPRFRGWPPPHPDMTGFLGVPILATGDVVGAFYVAAAPGDEPFSDEGVHRLELLAAHAAIALENARLFEASRELSAVAERDRLARELHDSMSQTLFSIALTAESAAAVLHADPERAADHLRTVRELASAVQEELRTLIHELQPPQLREDGLVTSLRRQATVLGRVHGVAVTVRGDPDRRLDADAERDVFRITQEALSNALRHADANTIEVDVDVRDRGVNVTVRDDGVGFDPSARAIATRRLGLASMRERARRLGGTLDIRSRVGAGTTVRLHVPELGAHRLPTAPP